MSQHLKIAILLSGGVDSSVAASLLKAEGHVLEAFYIKIWLEDELQHIGECPWQEDLDYAHKVCDQLQIPLHIVSLQTEYLDRVVSYTIRELKEGRTPSPDIFCNARIKFGAFLEKIPDDFEKVATGHYARIHDNGSCFQLLRAKDPVKDQTYFLSHLNQAQLRRALFPIGSIRKKDVRAYAQQTGLPTKNRKDSQGICFLGNIKFNEFVQFHLGEQPGDIVDITSSEKLGSHRGYWYHTIGQRHGLGLSGGPWYVVKKNIEENVVYVSHLDTLHTRKRNAFKIHSPSWISDAPFDNQDLFIKIRHGENLIPGRIHKIDNSVYEVSLQAEDAGIASGQFAVFYDGENCLGCGMIT